MSPKMILTENPVSTFFQYSFSQELYDTHALNELFEITARSIVVLATMSGSIPSRAHSEEVRLIASTSANPDTTPRK